MRIAVVAAVSRPERVAAVVEAFNRQTYADRELVLVINGPARDAQLPELPARVLRCEGGNPARARNAGLSLARELAPLVAFIDDDDAYLPGYLTEVVDALVARGPRCVVGRHVRFVRFDDGLYFFQGRQDSFLGGTLAGWSSWVPDFPDRLGEDREWCFDCQRRGFELLTLSPLNFTDCRRSGAHDCHATQMQMLAAFGPALRLGDLPDDVCAALPDNGDLVPRPTVDELMADLVDQQARRLSVEHAA